MDKDMFLNISNISLYSAFILYLVAIVHIHSQSDHLRKEQKK